MKTLNPLPVHRLSRTLTCTVISCGLALSASLVPLATLGQDRDGQRVVNVIEEPRHRPVHVDGDLYLLDVQLNPGDESMHHTHDAAILLTYISSSDGPVEGRVSSNTDYASEQFTHKITNNGTHQTRIIALVNFGPPTSHLTMDRPAGVAVEPQLENSWFRSYRLELAPGEATTLRTHRNPTAVVQVSPGLAHVSRVDGITEELDSPGDWAWRDSDSPFLVRNIGTEPVAVVINEGRR